MRSAGLAALAVVFCGVGLSAQESQPAPAAKPTTRPTTRPTTKPAEPVKTGWVTEVVQAPRLEYRTFESRAAKAKVSYHIYVPEAYGQDKKRRFPVIYYLHGSGGGLKGLPFLARHFDEAIRTGKIPPMLVVFPNGRRLSLWLDSKDGSVPMETVLVKELIPHIDKTWRTRATREGRLIEGFSMGGYGAAHLGFKYPELFATVSILSGGPLQQKFTHSPRVNERRRRRVLKATFGNDHGYFEAVSPWVLAEKNADKIRKTVRLRMVIGEKDEMFAVIQAFEKHLNDLEIPHSFTVVPRLGHQPGPVIRAIDEKSWKFYRSAFARPPETPTKEQPMTAPAEKGK